MTRIDVQQSGRLALPDTYQHVRGTPSVFKALRDHDGVMCTPGDDDFIRHAKGYACDRAAFSRDSETQLLGCMMDRLVRILEKGTAHHTGEVTSFDEYYDDYIPVKVELIERVSGKDKWRAWVLTMTDPITWVGLSDHGTEKEAKQALTEFLVYAWEHREKLGKPDYRYTHARKALDAFRCGDFG